MKWIHAAKSRLRLLSSRRSTDARFDDEMRFHLDMEAERLQRDEGLSASEAHRRAHVSFGGVEKTREQLRDVRGGRWLGSMSLDLKLAVRMLRKSPWLAGVGVIGMSVAIAIGAFAYAFINGLVGTDIPVPEGNRLVIFENWDVRNSQELGRTHLHDIEEWRTSVSSVEELGTFRIVRRNVISQGAEPEPMQVAEVSPSLFRVSGVSPLKGRALIPDDDRPGATPVAVIGYRLWQNRFSGSADVVGRSIQIGATHYTIAGVMPEGYHLPVNNVLWVAPTTRSVDFRPGDAPDVRVFGRLAEGRTVEDAQREATQVQQRLASSRPPSLRATTGSDGAESIVRTRVLPYGLAFTESPSLIWLLHILKFAVSLLLLLISVNVATLVYARTASRVGEIAVRTALGASRRRIVGQLFIEAFVLSFIAAVVGLAIAVTALDYLVGHAQRIAGDQLPYWMSFDVTPGLVVYVVLLAAGSAFVIGGLPALKATRANVRGNLQELGAGGGGLKMGRGWTALIVTQVAVAVAILPVVVHGVLRSRDSQSSSVPEYQIDQWLTATMQLDRDERQFAATTSAARDSLHNALLSQRLRTAVDRLENDGNVRSVLVTSSIPGAELDAFIVADPQGGPSVGVAIDSMAIADTVRQRNARGESHYVGHMSVTPAFFETFGIPVIAGRTLDQGDIAGATNAVVINLPFAKKVFGDANPIGRRIQFVYRDYDESAEARRAPVWYDIVGVVANFPRTPGSATKHPVLYRPLREGSHGAYVLGVQVASGVPERFGTRMREVVIGIDPKLRLEDIKPLGAATSIETVLDRVIFSAILLVTGSVVLLSAAGIYALMSFTITRRRREIGIRMALGAGARHVTTGVLLRAGRQVFVGVTLGSIIAFVLIQALERWKFPAQSAVSLGAVGLFMAAVGVAAAWRPARTAMSIQPTECLRHD